MEFISKPVFCGIFGFVCHYMVLTGHYTVIYMMNISQKIGKPNNLEPKGLNKIATIC
jgi:hypothetical protein